MRRVGGWIDRRGCRLELGLGGGLGRGWLKNEEVELWSARWRLGAGGVCGNWLIMLRGG